MAPPPSRFAQIQMQFQQRQQEEREKKLQLMMPSANNESSRLAATLGPGKVRQMFDERRQRGTGFDKSYPLQPIPQKTNVITNSPISKQRTNVTTARNINGNNNSLLYKLDGNSSEDNSFGDVLDDEQFIDASFDFNDNSINDIKMSTNIGKLKLNSNNNSSVSRLSSIKKVTTTLGDVKLNPVVLKKSNSVEPTGSLENRKLLINRTAPLSTRSNLDNITKKANSANVTSIGTPRISSPVKPKDTSPIVSPLKVRPKIEPKSVRSPTSSVPPPDSASCKNCGRYFNKERIEKHEQICKKTSKKRKVFDITKKRIEGTEAEGFVKKAIKSKTSNTKITAVPPAKKSDWRKKHEEFIAAIRAAKEVQQHLAKGGKLSELPPPPPSENLDYIQCPHCNRRFNEAAATRHIPKCASMMHNKPKPKPVKKKF